MQTALHRFHAEDLQMNKPVYGEGPSRVGVRQITPKIYWICHCIGKGVEHYNGGFASEFAKVNPALDPTANDIFYSSYLFLDEKTFLIDTLGPWQHETVLEALTDLLDGRKLDYLWITATPSCRTPRTQPLSGVPIGRSKF